MNLVCIMIVDIKGMVAGRVATKIAKLVINGERVIVVNAEEAIIVGNKENILEKFRTRVNAAVKSNPHYGPKYARIPDRMFRKMVRNMLPTKKRTKERMIKKLSVYNSFPAELGKEKAVIFEEYKFNERNNYLKLKEIANLLGGRW